MLNRAPLTPYRTNYEPLDKKIDEIFAQIHTPGMSTYQKVKACYDYMVDNFIYWDSGLVSECERNYNSDYDYRMIRMTDTILSTGKGVCDHYSCAFAVMCRRIGLDAYVISGEIIGSGEYPNGHAWSYIVLEGTQYIFDTQVQAKSKDRPYFFFGKTYAQFGNLYGGITKYYEPDKFCNFELKPVVPDTTMKCNLRIDGHPEMGPYEYYTDQQGKNLFVKSLKEEPIVGKADKTVSFTVTPSGGSGYYILRVAVGNGLNGMIFYEAPIQSTATVTYGYSGMLTYRDWFLSVTVFDRYYDSTIIFSDIYVASPEPSFSLSCNLWLAAYELEESVEWTIAQNGENHVAYTLAEQPFVWDTDGSVTMGIMPSGGSGQYTLKIMAADGDSPAREIIYEGNLREGQNYVDTLCRNDYSYCDDPHFIIVLYDRIYDSYLRFENIRILPPEEYAAQRP